MSKIKHLAIFSLILFLLAPICFAATSQCVKFERSKVLGTGPLPYNYRVIDRHIHAGGHPLGPTNNFGNTDAQAMSILKYLKSKGVYAVIDLENTGSIEKRYRALLKQAGLKFIHIPMSYVSVPNSDEWQTIREAMKNKVYIHCKWGADRTGAVLAKYLIEEKGCSMDAAIKAVSTGGTHAGVMGGMKKTYRYNPIYRNFWQRKG
jgi:protein tyrosine phosphatase (PTP) superfamily phosphohydrolase (DUF442 family)